MGFNAFLPLDINIYAFTVWNCKFHTVQNNIQYRVTNSWYQAGQVDSKKSWKSVNYSVTIKAHGIKHPIHTFKITTNLPNIGGGFQGWKMGGKQNSEKL